MSLGLRKMLIDEIRNRRYLTYEEAEDFARRWGFRVTNMDRRLRLSESPDIESIKSDKPPYAKLGYRYTGTEKPKVEVYVQRQQSLILK